MTENFEVDGVAIAVFCVLFGFVTVLGFVAARWKRGDLGLLDEWGLGGRRFGTVITWFLLGGDLFTAYTFIAVPALVWAVGAGGFFALPYTVLVFPFVFLVMPRLWSVASKHRYVTGADFVKGRYGSRSLATAIAFTGLLATMPYIALQLVGIQVVLGGLGIEGEWPLVIAFAILAAYTYTSGLRAPAMIALVKDTLIYATVLVAIIYIPSKLGGWDAVFASASEELPQRDEPGALVPSGADAQVAYATLALGSAMALFLYPHALTAVLSSRSQVVVRRNMSLLPAWTFLLGLMALLGYMAIAAGLNVSDPNNAVPALFVDMFPSWFLGVAFAAIAIGALVPAAVMSIAAANLFTRNVWKEFVRPNCSDAEESQVAKIVSLVVKVGALAFVIFLPTQFAIDLQLLGGVWMLQTLPAVMIALYTRWFHRWGLLAGWAVGMVFGTWVAASQDFEPVWEVPVLSVTAYTALAALAVNLVVAAALTLLLGDRGRSDDEDETRPEEYDELEETREPAPTAGAGVG
ncbi:MAG TPA: sodium:solute symporter family protein [Thermoleophilaceae bacterium]|nr:sodium:solute symporter family protein [Thermoleophilaceae bacterium]